MKPGQFEGLTSRISGIQPAGGVARAAMGAALTELRAARATRAREKNLDMVMKERYKKRVGGWREWNAERSEAFR